MPFFQRSELQCKCGCGHMGMDPSFMARLENLRVAYGKPMPVSSGYRCPKHNASVALTGTTGPHTTGMAVDIRVSGDDAHKLLALAYAQGYAGIGINQRGDMSSRYIHLDNLGNGPTSPRPRTWSY